MDEIDKAASIMAYNVNEKDFDEEHLVPIKLIELSNLLQVDRKLFYDDYYKFVFYDYSDFILKFREQNNLTQKGLAKLISVSPTYVLSWEAKKSFPNREQYRRLIKLFHKGI
jgi:ribosome-binding protein aMBF1 (putative translation factor)